MTRVDGNGGRESDVGKTPASRPPRHTPRRLPSIARPPALLGFAFWIALAACAQDANPTIDVDLLGERYRLEVVDTPERRQVGLMNRRALAPGRGMLFWYPRAGDHRIWMKNTLIPLTVIWLDDEARILKAARLTPCGEGGCPSFGAGNDTRFILELPAEDLARFTPGDRLPAVLDYHRSR